MKKKVSKLAAFVTAAAMAASVSATTLIGSAATYKYGDVDLNGSVNIIDVITLCQATMGVADLTDVQAVVADCDGVAGLTSGDAQYIMRSLVKLITLDGEVEIDETTEPTEFTEETTEEPVTEVTEETEVDPTEEPSEETTAEPTENTSEETTEEPTEETTVEPTDETPEETVEETTEEPSEETTVEPTEETTEEPSEETTVEPTEETTEEPSEETTVEPTEETTEESSEETTEEPTEETTVEPTEETTEEETTAEPTEETTEETTQETVAALEGTTEVVEVDVQIETDENGAQKSSFTLNEVQNYERVQITLTGGVANCAISFYTYYGYWDNDLGEWVNGTDCPNYDVTFDENGVAVVIIEVPEDTNCNELTIGIGYYHSWDNDAATMVPNDQEGLTWEVVVQLKEEA